jgi:hypothetical protein
MSQQAPAQELLACSQCGRTFAHSDVVQIAGNWVCGSCKPVFLSRVMAAGAAVAGPFGWHYGGFWIRFGARFIDNFVLMAPIVILAAVFIPNLLRAGSQPSNGMFALFGLTFIAVGFLAMIFYEVLMLKHWGGNHWQNGLRAESRALRRPQPGVGRVLWALLHVERRHERRPLFKLSSYAGQRHHGWNGRREACTA